MADDTNPEPDPSPPKPRSPDASGSSPRFAYSSVVLYMERAKLQNSASRPRADEEEAPPVEDRSRWAPRARHLLLAICVLIGIPLGGHLLPVLVPRSLHSKANLPQNPNAPVSFTEFSGTVAIAPRAQIAPGFPVRTGSTISTGPQSRVEMLSPRGGKILLHSRSQLSLLASSPKGLEVSIERGCHEFDCTQEPAVEAQYKNLSLKGRDVWFSFDEDHGWFSIVVERGQLQVFDGKRLVAEMHKGDVYPVEE